jgi:hypothetical protein
MTITSSQLLRVIFMRLLPILLLLPLATTTATNGNVWPWMQGVEAAIASPIDPVSDDDVRPSVLELIKRHRNRIAVMAKKLQKHPLYVPEKHDDLWILRFLLSSNNRIKAALKDATTALQFRKDYNLDELDIRRHPATMELNHTAMRKFLSCCKKGAMSFTVPDTRRGVVTYFHYASINQHKLVEVLPLQERVLAMVYATEWSFQWLDYISRTTGRFTKEIRLIDMHGFQLSDANLENIITDGKAMRIMGDVYPQMLESIYMTRSPKWMQIPWRLVHPFLPKRVVSKLDFISPERHEEERKRLHRFVTEENLPVRFGGKNLQWPVPALVGDDDRVCADI